MIAATPAAPPAKVLIADGQPMVRDGVRAACEATRIDVIGSTGDGADLVRLLATGRPAVLVVDPDDFSGDTLRALRRTAARRAPRIRVLVLTSDVSPAAVHGAVQAGAEGYLAKRTATSEEIARAVSRLATGQTVLCAQAQHALALHLRRSTRKTSGGSGLTERERAITSLIAEGLTSGQIATRLSIGTSAVKTHTSSILRKLDVPDRSAAVAAALRQRIIR